MSGKSWLMLVPVVLLSVVTVAPSSSRPVGAPWLSVEMPPNPMNAATRDAALLVRAYYHERAADYELSGTAEGLVDGERQSVELSFTETQVPGVFAVRQEWADRGHWLLSVGIEGNDALRLLVELGPQGGVEEAAYYEYRGHALAVRSVRVVPGTIDENRLDARLQALAARASD